METIAIKVIAICVSAVYVLTDAVLQRRVVSVDNGGPSVRNPVRFVDRLAQLLEGIVSSENRHV